MKSKLIEGKLIWGNDGSDIFGNDGKDMVGQSIDGNDRTGILSHSGRENCIHEKLGNENDQAGQLNEKSRKFNHSGSENLTQEISAQLKAKLGREK